MWSACEEKFGLGRAEVRRPWPDRFFANRSGICSWAPRKWKRLWATKPIRTNLRARFSGAARSRRRGFDLTMREPSVPG